MGWRLMLMLTQRILTDNRDPSSAPWHLHSPEQQLRQRLAAASCATMLTIRTKNSPAWVVRYQWYSCS